MTPNLHDKMLAAIDALFSASDGDERDQAEEQLLDVRDELLKQYRKAMQDALVGGTGIMKGGERIDPASIYSDIVSDGGMDPRNQFDKPAPVAHPVIAGALFDFMGWLTSRKKTLILSSADNASPAVEAITEFAKMRGLSLDGARVQDWQDTTPPAPQPVPVKTYHDGKPWVGLTDAEVMQTMSGDWTSQFYFARAIEAKLEEKNT